jgi:signal peptidase I
MKLSAKWKKEIKEIAILLVVFLTIRSMVVESFKIPSGSMIPTLHIGDYLFVNKFVYAIRVPFSDWFDKPWFIKHLRTPTRGEIIVFKHPKGDVNLIKRVVAVAGDTVEVKNKHLYINNQLLAREEIKFGEKFDKTFDRIDGRFFNIKEMHLHEENLLGVKHDILEDDSGFMFANWGPQVVPQGNVFCMGDNRDYSSDGRDWGFTPIELIKGKAMFIWFNLWLDTAKEQYYFNPRRIGTLIK